MAAVELTAVEAIKEVIALNPLNAYRVISRRENPCILSKNPPEELKLPEGWTLDTEDGITLKYPKQSGTYESIDVIRPKK